MMPSVQKKMNPRLLTVNYELTSASKFGVMGNLAMSFFFLYFRGQIRIV